MAFSLETHTALASITSSRKEHDVNHSGMPSNFRAIDTIRSSHPIPIPAEQQYIALHSHLFRTVLHIMPHSTRNPRP